MLAALCELRKITKRERKIIHFRGKVAIEVEMKALKLVLMKF